jgi:putative nucleotidyltransferase with HDIG domain
MIAYDEISKASPRSAERTGGAFLDTKAEIISSLRSLHDLLKAINSTLDINEVVELILERTASLMRSRRVLLLRLDPSHTELLVYRARGFLEKELGLRRFAGVRSFDHCLVHKGTVIHFEELLEKGDYEKAVAAVPALAKMFFAPLEIQGKAYGLLGVSGGRQDFSEIELEIFCALAGQAAVAIENANLYQRLKDSFHHTAAALAEAVNSRDPYTGGHVQRVQNYALHIATALELSGEQRDALRLAAILHDIGKIGIDDAILRKGGGLSEEEQRSMRKHPEIGARILAMADGMQEVAPGVRHHHEWFDGSGYPDGLIGEDIPLSARIIAIVDAFDALTTDRPYRTALPFSAALAELARGAGTHFDPALVKIFAESIHSA